MGEQHITIWFPVPAPVMAIFLGVLVIYMIYSAVKFIISIWTGA